MSQLSEIQKFYNGRNVFITGGTGFMGKVLIEKLLRSTDVSTIYLLIREKKGKNMHTRLDEIFDDLLFNRLKSESPKFKHRVVGIAGDCSVSGLALSIPDRQMLITNVHIVFHVAATVRFDENIKLAYSINVNGTGDVIQLCRQMNQLKALIHVSTAYSNCHLNEIDEKFYDYPVHYDDVRSVLEKLSDDEANKLTSRIIDKWPNTYTFTKALAESVIKHLGNGLPIGIFRPSIVISTNKEPIEGWIDNLYGPTGVCAGAASGLLRVFPCDVNVIADLVPVDTCVAGLLACAWDVAHRKRNELTSITIYNYVSSVENPVTWGEYNALNFRHGVNYPLSKSLWSIKFLAMKNYNLYLFWRIFMHIIPAFLFDVFAWMLGYNMNLLSMYKKIHKFSSVLHFFCTREWKFTNSNVVDVWKKMDLKDRELFPLSVTTVAWLDYFDKYYKGVRLYLMRDPISTLPEARRRLKRFEILHHMLLFVINFFFMSFLFILLIKFFGYSLTNNAMNHCRSVPTNGTCNF